VTSLVSSRIRYTAWPSFETEPMNCGHHVYWDLVNEDDRITLLNEPIGSSNLVSLDEDFGTM